MTYGERKKARPLPSPDPTFDTDNHRGRDSVYVNTLNTMKGFPGFLPRADFASAVAPPEMGAPAESITTIMPEKNYGYCED